jgi:hypothetical protein
MGFRGIVIKEGKSGAGRRPFELINYFRHGISLTSTPASCAVDALFHQNIFLAALGSSLGSWLRCQAQFDCVDRRYQKRNAIGTPEAGSGLLEIGDSLAFPFHIGATTIPTAFRDDDG